jgi:hypothetical protein
MVSRDENSNKSGKQLVYSWLLARRSEGKQRTLQNRQLAEQNRQLAEQNEQLAKQNSAFFESLLNDSHPLGTPNSAGSARLASAAEEPAPMLQAPRRQSTQRPSYGLIRAEMEAG